MHSSLISQLAAATISVLVLGLLITPAKSQALTTQPPIPQWQIDAGDKMAFEVASVKLDKPGGTPYSNFSLDDTNTYTPTGGLLSARNFSLSLYIGFAYKLSGNQWELLNPQIFGRSPLSGQKPLPKWVAAERFDVEVRAPISNPTKDQMRLMLQSVLADRFKLAAHWETRELPVYGLVLEKSDKMGSHLRTHAENPPCVLPARDENGAAPAGVAAVDGGYPAVCGSIQRLQQCPVERFCWGGRDVGMNEIAATLSQMNGATPFDRPILDRTGLKGNVDFTIEWGPNVLPGGGFQADLTAPTLLEAIKDQLGLKLDSQTGAVDVLFVDNVEEPSPN